MDLDKPILTFLSVTPMTNVSLAQLRGRTTVFEWGISRIVTRWDRGTVEMEFDPPSLMPDRYLPATCGVRTEGLSENGPVWIWGQPSR